MSAKPRLASSINSRWMHSRSMSVTEGATLLS
jgi:hypothetical protein